MSVTLNQPQRISPEAWANTSWGHGKKLSVAWRTWKRTKDVFAGDTRRECKIHARMPK